MTIEPVKTPNGTNRAYAVRATWMPDRTQLGTYDDKARAAAVHDLAMLWKPNGTASGEVPFEEIVVRWSDFASVAHLAEDDLALEKLTVYTETLRGVLGSLSTAQALPRLWDLRGTQPAYLQRRFNSRLARVARASGYLVPESPTVEPSELPSPEQIARLLAEARQGEDQGGDTKRERPWVLPAALLILGLGLKGNELLALRWEDVDLRFGGVAVRNNYQPHAVEPSPVPAHQCRCLQFQDALFDLGDEIDAALKALARAVATKPEWLSPGDFVFDGFAPEDTRKSRLAGVKYETRKALKLATLNSRIRELADRAGVPTELAQPRVLRLASGRAMWKRLIDQDDATPESCDLAVRRFLGAASERDIRRNLGLDEE